MISYVIRRRKGAIKAEKCPKLFNHLEHKGEDGRIFVNKKKIHCDEIVKRNNTRFFAVMQIKYPASGMFIAAVSSDGEVMPPRSLEA